MAKLQNEISERQEEINELKNEDETEVTKERIELREKWILESQNEVNRIKTDLQKFKIFAAIFESLPQFILQCSILVKRIYANDDIDMTDPIFWLQTSSSVASVFLTFTGLISEMPILVYETERPPIRSLSYAYTKVLPLVVLGATPQLLTLVGLLTFVSVDDCRFYIPYGIAYIGLLSGASKAIKWSMKKR